MSDERTTPTSWSPVTPVPPARLEGVLMARLGAWIVDVVIIAALSLLASMAITFLGVLTLGAGFVLMPLVALTGAGYAALTVGGPRQATYGMRMTGVKVLRSANGGAPDGLTAAVHALLFWVATWTVGLLMLDLLIGLFRADRRLGHDLLAGLAVVRA